MAGHVLDDGTGMCSRNRIGRQKREFDASGTRLTSAMPSSGFIVAVLAQTLMITVAPDLLAVVGDQAVGGRNGDVLSTGFVKGRGGSRRLLVASENIGVFAALTATTTCTSSKNRAERSITSVSGGNGVATSRGILR